MDIMNYIKPTILGAFFFVAILALVGFMLAYLELARSNYRELFTMDGAKKVIKFTLFIISAITVCYFVGELIIAV